MNRILTIGKISWLSLILMILLLPGCSTGNKDTQQSEVEAERVTDLEKDRTIFIEGQRKSTREKQLSVDSKEVKEEPSPAQETDNHPPKIKKIDIEVVKGNPRNGFVAHVISEDPEGDEVSYIYQWKLNGEDILGATDKYLPWQENFKKGDTISVEIIPYDEYAQGIWKAEGSFRIPNSPPIINAPQKVSITKGNLNYKIDAYDPDGDSIKFSLKNAPEGMTINPHTGEVSWVFSEEDIGDYNVAIVATDSEGAVTVQYMYFSIKKASK